MKNTDRDEDINSKALFINKVARGRYNNEIRRFKLDPIGENEVIIKSMYSSINYKDMLISDGNPGLVRRYPHIPGIDVSGIVYRSKNKKFNVGDRVMVVARPLGVEGFGGLSEYVKVPANWVEKLPTGMSEKQAMIFGTAGFTAALAVQKLLTQRTPQRKAPILVTGASGGVGSMSVYLLKSSGFKITAMTSSLDNKTYLKSIGADEVISYSQLQKDINLPLLKETYLSIVDNIGGDIVTTGIKTIQKNGSLILIGNVVGSKFEASITPFLLRGVSIIGINAESCSENERRKIWKMLASHNNEKKIEKLYKVIKLDETASSINRLKTNRNIGRVVVQIDDSLG